MLSPYVPIVTLFALAAAFAVFSVTAAPYVGTRRSHRATMDFYEYGLEPPPPPVSGRPFPRSCLTCINRTSARSSSVTNCGSAFSLASILRQS